MQKKCLVAIIYSAKREGERGGREAGYLGAQNDTIIFLSKPSLCVSDVLTVIIKSLSPLNGSEFARNRRC